MTETHPGIRLTECRAAENEQAGNYGDSGLNPPVTVSSRLANHPSHLGDLPNLVAIEGRKGSPYTSTNRVIIADGMTMLFDKDGSAFIIHTCEDKEVADPPSKDAHSGARMACGVIVMGYGARERDGRCLAGVQTP